MTKAELFKNYATMCQSISCGDCPLGGYDEYRNCRDYIINYPEKVVEIIEEWAEQQKHKDEIPFIDYLMSKLPIINRD